MRTNAYKWVWYTKILFDEHYRCYTSIVHILTSRATIGRSSLGNVHERNFGEL